jgi:hypothetical protein
LPKDYPTSVRFNAETKLGLMRAAKRQGTTVTWLVQHICHEWLKRMEREKKTESDQGETSKA